MAVVAGKGISRILENRRFEDYKSLKQHFQHNRRITEVIIEGACTTGGAGPDEINFCGGDVINYIAAEGQAYIRCEQDDAGQHSKYVYLQYQDDTGAIQDWVTADLDAANSVTEIAIGSTDFYRVRQMYSEVESSANDAIMLTDADMGGVDDVYGFIDDGNSQFNLERFFTQPNTTCRSFLAKIHVHAPPVAIGAGTDTFLLEYTFTPRAITEAAEDQTVADKSITYKFQNNFTSEPCYELEGGTEVIFKIGDIATAQIVHFEAILVEVYPDARP